MEVLDSPGLVPTGQGSGNTTDPGLAMTAPGSEPSAAYPPDHGTPGLAAEPFAATNRVSGQGG